MHFETKFTFTHSGEDFSNISYTVTVPATEGTSGTFTIPINFTIFDDDINEIEQSFALVAQLGADVPDNFTCFQNQVGDTECFGRKGATEIKILDNDRKL